MRGEPHGPTVARPMDGRSFTLFGPRPGGGGDDGLDPSARRQRMGVLEGSSGHPSQLAQQHQQQRQYVEDGWSRAQGSVSVVGLSHSGGPPTGFAPRPHYPLLHQGSQQTMAVPPLQYDRGMQGDGLLPQGARQFGLMQQHRQGYMSQGGLTPMGWQGTPGAGGDGMSPMNQRGGQ